VKHPGLQWCYGLAVVLISLSSASAKPPASDEKEAAAMVARDFIKALASGETQDLAEQTTDPFFFDGRVVKGRANIEKYFRERLSESLAELKRHPDAQVDVFSYQTAKSLFGKPPMKFSRIKLKRCLFAAVSYKKRRGFLLILKKLKKEGWRVTAVTD
jgi:hypothetical protein